MRSGLVGMLLGRGGGVKWSKRGLLLRRRYLQFAFVPKIHQRQVLVAEYLRCGTCIGKYKEEEEGSRRWSTGKDGKRYV